MTCSLSSLPDERCKGPKKGVIELVYPGDQGKPPLSKLEGPQEATCSYPLLY